MKTVSLGAIAAAYLLSAGGASAQPMPTYDWSGAYIGAHFGGMFPSADIDSFDEQIQQASGAFIPSRGIVIVPGTTRTVPAASTSNSTLSGGLQAGWLAMSDSLVYGLEADVESPSRTDTVSTFFQLPVTAIQAPSELTVDRTVKMSTSWTLRGHLGWAWDRFQIYLTGGMVGANIRVAGTDFYNDLGGNAALSCIPGGAICNLQTANASLINVTGGEASSYHIGWTVGGGGEWALTDKVSLGVEYRHSDYGTETFNLPTNDISVRDVTFTAPPGAIGNGATIRGLLSPAMVALTDERVSLRLNWHFN